MPPQLEYINAGRGGYVIYKDDTDEIKMFFEYGGGNCIAMVYFPSIEKWPKVTKIGLDQRDRIMQFVAEQSIKDQAPNSRFELADNMILILQPE